MENYLETQTTKIEVNWLDRWQVYYRLQDLEIDCSCRSNQPLKTNLSSPQDAIQIWSVAKQFSAKRQELINWLSQCWQIEFRS